MPDAPTKVLIVDDQESNLVALSGLLLQGEAEILVARSGQDALELLLMHEVAVAIIDVQMPVMDGFELAELMRGVERTRHVPIIFLTAGEHDDARRFRGYHAGAVDFLYKPIEPEILRRKVGVFVQLSRQRQDLAGQRDALHAIAEEKSRLVVKLEESQERFRASEDRLRLFSLQLEQLVEERTGELTQSQKQLRALATELNLTEQRERKRLAVELHDHLAQMLVLCRLKLGQSKRISGVVPDCQRLIRQTEEVLDEALTYTRTLVADLAPPVLHDFGLPAALKWLAAYMERHELTVSLNVPDDVQVTLPEDQAVLLFQSARELLMNASKHAETGAATLSLSAQDGALHIEVRDSGKGMDPLAAQVPSFSSKFGLFSIRERMRALGGAFEIESAPGQGSTARLVLPLQARDKRDEHDRREARDPLCVMRDAVNAETPGSQRSAISSAPGGASRITDHGSRSSKTSVLLVDDHAMVRQGLRTVLDGYADLDVVGEAANGEEAVACVEKLHPRVVVMDINMPRMNGIDATALIKARAPDTIIIGLSVNAQGENQHAMTTAGAALLLTKEAAVDELYRSIRELLPARR